MANLAFLLEKYRQKATSIWYCADENPHSFYKWKISFVNVDIQDQSCFLQLENFQTLFEGFVYNLLNLSARPTANLTFCRHFFLTNFKNPFSNCIPLSKSKSTLDKNDVISGLKNIWTRSGKRNSKVLPKLTVVEGLESYLVVFAAPRHLFANLFQKTWKSTTLRLLNKCYLEDSLKNGTFWEISSWKFKKHFLFFHLNLAPNEKWMFLPKVLSQT